MKKFFAISGLVCAVFLGTAAPSFAASSIENLFESLDVTKAGGGTTANTGKGSGGGSGGGGNFAPRRPAPGDDVAPVIKNPPRQLPEYQPRKK